MPIGLPGAGRPAALRRIASARGAYRMNATERKLLVVLSFSNMYWPFEIPRGAITGADRHFAQSGGRLWSSPGRVRALGVTARIDANGNVTLSTAGWVGGTVEAVYAE